MKIQNASPSAGMNMKKLEALLETDINVTEFTEESAQKFRDQVMFRSERNLTEPIIIYIDSYGGQVDSLAKMIETMDEVPNPFVTVTIGKAMSCGAILLSHGNLRYVGRHSRVMIHEVSSGTWGDVHDMKNDANESIRLNEYWLGLLADNCKITGGYAMLRSKIKDRDGRDIYLSAEDAVKFGIADSIGLPKLMPIVQHDIIDVPIKKKINFKAELVDEPIATVPAPSKPAKKGKSKTDPKRNHKKGGRNVR